MDIWCGDKREDPHNKKRIKYEGDGNKTQMTSKDEMAWPNECQTMALTQKWPLTENAGRPWWKRRHHLDMVEYVVRSDFSRSSCTTSLGSRRMTT